MNRQPRYEAVPQHEEPIILSPINNASYNYNTALPTSVASSSHGGPPSIISEVPNSPPPSFHTHSSPGTPRPSHSQLQQQSQYEELWGVAPSTIGGETTIGTSNDALATIKGLKQRVEWLEESMGRLLLEKENAQSSTHKRSEEERTNCCVAFSDVSPDLERALTSRGTNCCVTYNGTSSAAKRKEQRLVVVAVLFVFLVLCILIGVIVTARSGRVNRAVNGAVDKAVRLME